MWRPPRLSPYGCVPAASVFNRRVEIILYASLTLSFRSESAHAWPKLAHARAALSAASPSRRRPPTGALYPRPSGRVDESSTVVRRMRGVTAEAVVGQSDAPVVVESVAALHKRVTVLTCGRAQLTTTEHSWLALRPTCARVVYAASPPFYEASPRLSCCKWVNALQVV